MKIGVQIPLGPGAGTSEPFRDYLHEIERLGYASVWLGDHIVIPKTIANMDSYPYGWRFSPDLGHFFPDKSFLEPISTCGFIAGATKRVEIGVGVFVVPMRNPVELAKELACIDVLAGGRLIAGVGAGWMEEEFVALDRPYKGRGARLDEAVALMRALWSGEVTTFEGKYFQVRDIYCQPTPTRAEGPPIWVGGHTDLALDRCARYASGWHAIELPPDEFAHHSARLDERLATAGRDPGEVVRSVATRVRLSGPDLDEARQTVKDYAAAGCEHLVLYTTPTRSIEENLERFQRFEREIGLDVGAPNAP
jgi:probable F420-dependent oxidoreductase